MANSITATPRDPHRCKETQKVVADMHTIDSLHQVYSFRHLSVHTLRSIQHFVLYPFYCVSRLMFASFWHSTAGCPTRSALPTLPLISLHWLLPLAICATDAACLAGPLVPTVVACVFAVLVLAFSLRLASSLSLPSPVLLHQHPSAT